MPHTSCCLILAAAVITSSLNGIDSIAGPTQRAAGSAKVTISNRHLVATCISGQAAGKQREWHLSTTTVMAFTMKNEPRPGIENHAPGFATIEFTPEPGHQYEIEVRGDAAAYSTRVWTKGDWKPVVRDRTTDRIVSSEPVWIETGCRR
jgi:hypothetical protein